MNVLRFLENSEIKIRYSGDLKKKINAKAYFEANDKFKHILLRLLRICHTQSLSLSLKILKKLKFQK